MNAFDAKVDAVLPDGLHANGLRAIQVNLGRLCNLSCSHCHLECSPERDELMAWDTMQAVVKTAVDCDCPLVDITGGAPELHPDFRPFISALRDAERRIQVRTNLAVLVGMGLMDIMKFLCIKGVGLVASLPGYEEKGVDGQRGAGVFAKCIDAILQLNELGYGFDEELPLHLVCNPPGTSLPGDREALEADFRQELDDRHDIHFTGLIVLANAPIGRFGKTLNKGSRKKAYLAELEDAFTPDALDGLMCRRQICVDWDGRLYDCDFNLALGVALDPNAPQTVSAFDPDALGSRRIVTGEHCFACTVRGASTSGG